MCGIFGVYSNSLVVKSILDGLSKLEYRGYDSSGISILDQNKKIHILSSEIVHPIILVTTNIIIISVVIFPTTT